MTWYYRVCKSDINITDIMTCTVYHIRHPLHHVCLRAFVGRLETIYSKSVTDINITILQIWWHGILVYIVIIRHHLLHHHVTFRCLPALLLSPGSATIHGWRARWGCCPHPERCPARWDREWPPTTRTRWCARPHPGTGCASEPCTSRCLQLAERREKKTEMWIEKRRVDGRGWVAHVLF